MADIDFGQLSEALNDKMDRDANNIASPKLPIFLVAKQDPTSSNNYTWYRKYSDGFVIQGGRTGAVNGTDATTSVTLPITMSDANYGAYVTISRDANGSFRDQFLVAYNRSTTSFRVYSNWAGSGNGSQNNYAQWLVCGIAA